MGDIQYHGVGDAVPEKKESKLRKYGPAIFWGTMMALPAMNMTAAIYQYRTAKLNFQTELLRTVTGTVDEVIE